MRDDQIAAGHVSAAEAKEILSRFNASHFRQHGKEHARYTIPADPKRDDDIRMSRFIAQCEERDAEESARASLVDRIGALLSANGCDCDCDHHQDEHDDDCERCLACRIAATLDETTPTKNENKETSQ